MGEYCCCCKRTNKFEIFVTSAPFKENINKININDFEKLKTIGSGSFGNVYLVRYKKDQKIYALKVLYKSIIKQKRQETHTINERILMSHLDNPLMVKMYCCFQDEKHLYFLMEFVQGGELFYHLRQEFRFDDDKTRFYIAELILALECLHENNIIYRDIKPENILIDKTGHIKLIDFGLSKFYQNDDEKMYTICGTPFYLAPEVLSKKGYNSSVDWWSLGCLMYEMLSGKPPFKLDNNDVFSLKFDQPIQMLSCFSEDAKDLISKLLVVDPQKRLGANNDVSSIKAHPYFKYVKWGEMSQLKAEPPFIPELSDELDLRYISNKFTDLDESTNSKEEKNNVDESVDNYVNFSYYEKMPDKSVIDKDKSDIGIEEK